MACVDFDFRVEIGLFAAAVLVLLAVAEGVVRLVLLWMSLAVMLSWLSVWCLEWSRPRRHFPGRSEGRVVR